MDAILATLAPRRQVNYNKIYSALIMNLAPTLPKNVPLNFFEGKLETFLTCRKLSSYMKENILDEKTGIFFEEAALNAVHKTLMTPTSIADIRLLISEMPEILPLGYPVVKDIVRACIQIIPKIMFSIRSNVPWHLALLWLEHFHLSESLNLLKAFDKVLDK